MQRAQAISAADDLNLAAEITRLQTVAIEPVIEGAL